VLRPQCRNRRIRLICGKSIGLGDSFSISAAFMTADSFEFSILRSFGCSSSAILQPLTQAIDSTRA